MLDATGVLDMVHRIRGPGIGAALVRHISISVNGDTVSRLLLEAKAGANVQDNNGGTAL